MFPIYCQRPCFTPIQKHRQNYSLVHSNLHIFWQQARGQKVLDRMVACITRFNLLLISSWIKFWFVTVTYSNLSQFSRRDPLLFLQMAPHLSSQGLSGPRSSPTATQKFW
jgi:hypothetical protein